MRIMMPGHPMSPLYWTDVKNGLHDLVRQIGYPHLYWTLAPYERSFPYHAFLLDEMQKLLRERLRLPAFETLHLAHTMLQVTRSLLAGRGQHRGVGWTQHLLGQGQGRNGVHFFTRFQDGSKKAGTQQYHGSGRPHVHALFWLANPDASALGSVAAATESLPESEQNLAAFVRGSQRDRDGESRWPLHDGLPQFDPASLQDGICLTQSTMPLTACAATFRTSWMLCAATKIYSLDKGAACYWHTSQSTLPSGQTPHTMNGCRTQAASLVFAAKSCSSIIRWSQKCFCS